MTDKKVIKLAQELITDFKCESDTMVDFCNTVIKKFEQEPCEDCISREETLNKINELIAEYIPLMPIGWTLPLNIAKTINELPPVISNTEWIPVSERLPEPNRLVLCHITTGTTVTYFLAFWNDIQNDWEEGIGGYRLLKNDLEYEVIEWMPLPEDYKEVNPNEIHQSMGT